MKYDSANEPGNGETFLLISNLDNLNFMLVLP